MKLLLQKCKKTGTRAHLIFLTLLLTGSLVLPVGIGLAGQFPSNVHYGDDHVMEIQLLGATEFGAVQLFQYLLGRVENVTAVEAIGLRIDPATPQTCRASWRVATSAATPVELVWQLSAILKDLDPAVQNEVLYESPFIVAEGDLVLVKRAEPLVVSRGSAVFVIGALSENLETVAYGGRATTGTKWSLLPGAGFD